MCHSVNTYNFVESVPQHSEDVDGADGRSQEASHTLDVNKQLGEALNDWNPTDSNDDHAQDKHPDEKQGHIFLIYTTILLHFTFNSTGFVE